MDFGLVLDKKFNEAQNDIDKMEFVAIKSVLNHNYNDLLKMFGFDKNKIMYDVEKYLGRKLSKPQQDQSVNNQPQAQSQTLKQDFTPMTAESAADFFRVLS